MTTALEQLRQSNTDSEFAESISGPETRSFDRSEWHLARQDSTGPSTSIARSDQESSHGEDLVSTTVQAVEAQRPVKRIRPVVTPNGVNKVLLQQWECVVTHRDDEVVGCDMHDLTCDSSDTEYAEIFLYQFNAYDIPFLTEGAVFYWSLGYLRRPTGQILNLSEFILRRNQTLTRKQRADISQKVEKLRGLLPNS